MELPSPSSDAPPTTPPDDVQLSSSQPKKPNTKRQAKRTLNKNLAAKAVELDQKMRASIDEGAEALGVAPETLASRFAIIAPVGETRRPMWWNGLVAEKSEEWKDEYDGPAREFLPWVTRRLKNEKIGESLSEAQKEMYAKKAAEKRVSNKEQKAVSMTREKALKSVEDKIESIFQELQQINSQSGIEFALFATRSSMKDDFDPIYLSSEKVQLFFEGHIKMPAKELLKAMDMSIVSGVAGLSVTIANERERHRHAIREALNASFCTILKSLGHDVTKFKHIKYSNYSALVQGYCVILRGYPLTADGRIVSPSDYPGGIPGMVHAEKQLLSGVWGFEKIRDAAYNDWMAECDAAQAKGESAPLPPHIHVPGTEFVKPSGPRKRATKDKGGNGNGKRKKPSAISKGKKAAISRETIDSEESEEEFVGDGKVSEESEGESGSSEGEE
ncbi:hypothetical protein FRC08_001759 [Ceratobasidium sp. 394]|nr:hypothetical protein FRC08_001759 [Ceratobasidium sp. 394]